MERGNGLEGLLLYQAKQLLWAHHIRGSKDVLGVDVPGREWLAGGERRRHPGPLLQAGWRQESRQG